MRTTILTVVSMLMMTLVPCTGCATSKAEPVASRPSLTVFPVQMAGASRDDVARLVALMLERHGLTSIEVDDAVFAPPAAMSFEEQSRAFGAFVASRDLTTEYALYGAVLGSPDHGVAEVRSVLAARDGTVVWSDHQTRESRALKRAKPSDPMSSTVFLVDRLREPLDLSDRPRTDGPEGRWARQWREASLVPSDDERAAMSTRLDALVAAAPGATVLVYPARHGDAWSVACADRLVEEINREGVLSASAAHVPIEFDVQPSTNQQQVLWSAARSIQTHVRTTPVAADYVLLTDYVTSGPTGAAVAVHTFLLTSNGDFVIVDYQNDHHDDFRRIHPRSLADCCDLTLVRLERHVKG